MAVLVLLTPVSNGRRSSYNAMRQLEMYERRGIFRIPKEVSSRRRGFEARELATSLLIPKTMEHSTGAAPDITPSAVPLASAADSDGDEHNQPVMVIDDDPSMRAMVCMELESHGIDSIEARDGEDALQQLRDGPIPKLIILDLSMPIKDGYDFRREQLEDPQLSSIPVVLHSAEQDASSIAGELDAIASYEKGLDLPKMVEFVMAYLGTGDAT